jgi:hypothetical protein
MDEQQTQEEGDAQYVFVKLSNGDNLMCTTFTNISQVQGIQFLEVIDPIQIFSFKMPHNGNIIEKFIFQAWTPFSKTTATMIPINNVVFVGHLKDYFIERYIDYITDPNAQQVLQESGPEVMEDDDETTVEEMTEELLEENNNTKKWYH